MVDESSSIKDVETAPPLNDKENEEKHNHEPLEDDQVAVKLEIFKEEDDDFSENKYLRIEDEEASGDGVLGEDIMDHICCNDRDEYSSVKEFSFRHKLQSFCDTCYQKRLSKSEWMDIMYEWYESCTICMILFYNNLDMVNRDCTCENFYYCNNCALIFVRKEDVARHLLISVCQSRSLNNVATGKSICGIIGVIGGTGSVSHLSTDKRYILRCKGEVVDDIEKEKSSASSYKINNFLLVNKSYKCNHCDRCLTCASNLKVHLHIHSGGKLYSCQICKDSFSESGNLKRHLCTHSGKKPYSFQIFKKSFSDSSTIKSHLRTHSGAKPFSCNLCKKLLSLSGNLKKHLCTHSGENSYSCQICKKSFYTSGSLKRHLQCLGGFSPEWVL